MISNSNANLLETKNNQALNTKSLTSINKQDTLLEPSLAVLKKEKKVVLKSIENIDAKINKNLSKSHLSSTPSSSSTSISSRFSFNYSYVVLAASFFSYMLASLLSTCFGVFFENLEADLGWSKSNVAFIGGLISSLQDLTGPISSALTNQFGCRKTAFFGGLIAALGMIGSAYVNQFWLLGFLMGGVTGFGTSLVLVSSVVVVTYYFEEKPSFAAGLTISGGSLGQSIFSLIIIKLNEIYGRSGCFLILGGILLNILVCAALFRPLKWELEDGDDDEDDEDDDESSSEESSEEENSTQSSGVYKKDENNNLLEAPCARIETISNLNQDVVSINENTNLISVPIEHVLKKRFLKSSINLNQQSSKYAFLSDSCLPKKYLDLEQQANNILASEISLKSNMPNDEIKPIKSLMSGNFDSISLSRCHSLELNNKSSKSEINLKPNSSVPTDLQSLESNLKSRDFIVSESKKGVELVNVNDEYVVVDAEDIANCGSNLIISSSQNAIYVPILSQEDEKTEINLDQKVEINLESKLDQELPKSIKNVNSAQEKLINQQNTNKNVFSFLINKFKAKENQNLNQQIQINSQNQVVLPKKKPQHNQNAILINKNGQKIPHKKYIIAKCNCKHRNVQNFTKNSFKKPNSASNNQIVPNYNQQNQLPKQANKVKHLPSCPFYYINLSRVQHYQLNHNQHNHHHHHHKTSLYHVPNLFQNSYRFPLHFRNVYYYKSLLNLNMRIMVLRPHNAGALTVNAPANVNNVSLSCPDLNLKQILILKHKNQFDLTNKPVLTIANNIHKTSKNKIDNSKLENLKSCSGAKVLNAGSILVLNPSSNNNKLKKDSVSLIPVEKKNKDNNLKLLEFNLDEYNDKIIDEEEDEEEDDDEEEDSEDEDSDEECDNCLTQTKVGNNLYKFIYKPVIKPLKFIYYSIKENLKLFRLFKFCIFAFCNFVLSFFYEAPFYFINSFMTENGSTQSQAGTVTVAVGIVSVFSSIVYGYIGDSKRVNSTFLYSISLILCGLCCCAIPLFISNYLLTMILMIVIGALISVSDVLVPIILLDIVGYDDFVNAYGLMFFCQGLASFSGPPVLGIVADKSGRYTLSYYIIGAGICISGFILGTILCYDKLEKRKKSKIKKIDVPKV